MRPPLCVRWTWIPLSCGRLTTSKNHFRVRENNGYAAAVKGSHAFAGLRVAATRQGYRPGPYRQTAPYGRGSGHMAAWVV